ncbi:hypothetical protein LB507_005569, partial [Fusarium sp. FIESC RH6]
MKRSLLLALWSAGALGSPCKPARDLSGNNYYPPPPPNNYAPPPSNDYDITSSEAATLIASTQPGAVETPGSGSGSGEGSGSSSGDDEEGSVPTFTQGTGTQTTGLPQGDMTADPVYPGGTTRVPEASQASDADGVGVSGSPTGADGVATNSPGQPGDDSDNGSGSGNGNGGSGPQSSDGSSLADGVAATRTGTEGGSGATALPQTGDVTEGAGGDATAPGVGGDATQTPGSGSGSGNGNGNDNGDATQLPETGTATGTDGQPTGDVGNGKGNGGSPTSDGSSLADGVAATQTGTDIAGETPGSGDNGHGSGNGNGSGETTVDGAVPTGAVPGNGDSTDSPDVTQGQPDATTAGSGETGSPDSPDQTNVPGGQETSVGAPGSDDGSSPVTTGAGSDSTETPGAGNGDGSETTGAVPEQSDVSGNGDQTTQVPGGDSPETTDAPGQPEPVSSDANGVPTGPPGTNPDETTVAVPDNTAPADSETTAGAPGNPDETTAGSPDNGADETTAAGPDNTSPVENETSVNGNQPPETEDAPPATTEPVQDNTSIPVPDNNGPSTVEAVPTTDAGNDAPVTTAPVDGPGVTLNPAPVTTTAAPGTGGGNNGGDNGDNGDNGGDDNNQGDDDDDDDDDDNGGGSGGGNNNDDDDDDDDDDNGGGGIIGGGGSGPGGSGGGSSGGGNNGDNDNEDEDEDDDDEPTSTATSCTETATVTDCFVACTTYTGPAGATITPECSTTCTATHTGCSVTGTTTTSSAEACGPSGESCSTCRDSVVELESEVEPEALERRSLEKRKAPGNIGGCKFSQMPDWPEYPGGETVLKNDPNQITAKNSPLKDIQRWWFSTIGTNCSPLLQGNIDANAYKAGQNSGPAAATGGRPSIDHVYEKSMLLDFFSAIIDPNGAAVKGATTGGPRDKINCKDMESYGGAFQKSNKKLPQKVFNAYPGGEVNKKTLAVKDAQYLNDFIGMDQWTNGDAKGFVATPATVKEQGDKWNDGTKNVKATTTEADAKEWIKKKLGFLERMSIGIEMFSAQESIEIMIRQNQRIYARLMDIDNEAKGCMNDPAVKNGLWSFADRYKTFMEDRFEGDKSWSINTVVAEAKNKFLKTLTDDLENAKQIKAANAADWSSQLAQWNKRFNNMADFNRQWAVPEPAWVWSWVKKRDGEDSGLSCDRPIDSETTTSEDSTTFATSTRMTSEDQTTSSEDKVTTTTQAPIKLTDLPTLTNAPALSISTPDGSSCASTATYTQCNLGTGQHGDACVTNSECASWVNTKTTSTTPSPTPTLDSPNASQNIKHCYGSGQKSNYEAITYAAESFCRDVVSKNKDNGYYWSNDKLEGKKTPSTGYHFKLLFSVNEGCLWKADYDE